MGGKSTHNSAFLEKPKQQSGCSTLPVQVVSVTHCVPCSMSLELMGTTKHEAKVAEAEMPLKLSDTFPPSKGQPQIVKLPVYHCIEWLHCKFRADIETLNKGLILH